jgi:Na+-driven multidrug efflux pump
MIKMGLFMKGAAYAILVSFTARLVIYLVYLIFFNPYMESNYLCDKNTLNLEDFFWTFKTSLSSLIASFAETLGIHLISIMAAQLSYQDYAKFLIVINLCNLNWCFSFAFFNTAAIIIGKYVGLNSIYNIKKTIYYLFLCLSILHFPLVILTIIFKDHVIQIYTKDVNVYGDMNVHMIFCILLMISFIVNMTLLGIIRGLGYIKIISIVCFLGFTIIMPLSCYILIFIFNYRTYGIYIGSLKIYFSSSLFWIVYLIFFVDIEKVCKEYQLHTKEQNSKTLKVD